MLISPLDIISIKANAEGIDNENNSGSEATGSEATGNEDTNGSETTDNNDNTDSETIQKEYETLILKLKEDSISSDNTNTVATFYADNGSLSDKYILDYSDIVITATYFDSDNNEQKVTIDPKKTEDLDYSLDLNLTEISKKAGENQELKATLTFKDKKGRQISISSNKGGNNPKVTILESQTIKQTVKLKLKDAVKNNTFYAANDVLSTDDTLDAEDLELTYTYDISSFTDNYFDKDETDETKKYKTDAKTYGPIALETDKKEYTVDGKKFEITTNVDEVRKTAQADQELSAVLSYKEKDAAGKENIININSVDNPKVTVINATSTMKLKSISLALADKNKKFYVDNGYMKKDEVLSLNDLVLTLTYENGKTSSVNLGTLKTNEYSVTTNVDTIKKLVGKKQEITAKLTYKDAAGKEVPLTTIDSTTAAKDTTKNTKATTATVTILAPYAVNGVVTITPQNYGADPTDIKTDKAAIQDALDLASADYKLLVKVPAGTYYTGGNLFIHSNTTLSLEDGATIVRNSNSDAGVAAGTTNRLGVNKNLIKIAPYNSTTTNSAGGYTNGENIIIEGGTFDGGNISVATGAANLLNLGHAKNITIRNSTFKNCYGNHLIELVAVQNAEITGCSFSGFRYVTSQLTDDEGNVSYEDSSGNYAEAVQIDVAHKEGSSAWTSAYKTDDTACDNINIHDNTFSDYPVAIGNHHALAGHHNTNITVSYNKITGSKSLNTGINLCGCDNSNVTGNTIANYAAGIRVRASQTFTVSNNNIDTANYGIIETETSSGQITNNTINKLNNQGIIVYGSGTTATVVSLNTISNSQKSGILIHTNASCETVSSNKINSCTESGIKVYDSGSVNSLKTNTINDCHTNGIEICSLASVPSVTENTITNVTGCGINVYGTGGVANVSSITKNTITQSGTNGIEINSKATATNIKNNTVNKCNKYGIYVAGSASVKTISSNTIKNTVKNGIYVKNDKIKLTFKSNKLTRVGSTAIKINSKLSAKKTQKYTFAPKVLSLNLKGGVMTTQASNLKKIKLKVGSKSYTKSTKSKKYTFKFKKYSKEASSATVTFTDKNKNTVARVLDFD